MVNLDEDEELKFFYKETILWGLIAKLEPDIKLYFKHFAIT